MKLRLLENSVRIRLSVPEVASLGAGATVCAHLEVTPARSFRYAVGAAPGDAAIASFDGETLRIDAPAKDLERWSSTDAVTLGYTIGSGPGALAVTIEKDFQCLAPRDEDESELFPHPRNEAPHAENG